MKKTLKITLKCAALVLIAAASIITCQLTINTVADSANSQKTKLLSNKETTLVSSKGIKGVNNAHIWFDSKAYTSLDSIKNNDFNTVRVVWNTTGSGKRLEEILNKCSSLGIKPIPELHDVTGGTKASDIDKMVDYWIENKSHIPSDVWINIANEWGPSNSTVWRDAYIDGIKKMRSAGIENTIVIDSGGWGQDDKDILNYGPDILRSDSNVIFSIHMYGSWNDTYKINTFLTSCQHNGIPIMVGEFGYNYDNGKNNLGCKVDAKYLIKTCESKGIGYIAWSWCGNNEPNKWLDMTSDWNSLNVWGQLVKNTSVDNNTVIKYDFENSIEGWEGSNLAGEPSSVKEWHDSGSYSLKADIDLQKGKLYYLRKYINDNFTGKTSLHATVKTASWGNMGNGMKAKLFIQTGSNWQWYDGGETSINSNGTTLNLNLSNVANLNQVRYIGVQYIGGNNSSSRSAIYVDNVVLK